MDSESRDPGSGPCLGLVTASSRGGSVRDAYGAAGRRLARAPSSLGVVLALLGACAPPAASPIGSPSPTTPLAASAAAGTSAASGAAPTLPAATAVPVRAVNVGMVNVG